MKTSKNPIKEHIAAWKKSEMSMKAYCRINKIPHDKFQYWKNKIDDNKYFKPTPKEPIKSFIPISIREKESKDKLILEIEIEPNGKMILRIGNQS